MGKSTIFVVDWWPIRFKGKMVWPRHSCGFQWAAVIFVGHFGSMFSPDPNGGIVQQTKNVGLNIVVIWLYDGNILCVYIIYIWVWMNPKKYLQKQSSNKAKVDLTLATPHCSKLDMKYSPVAQHSQRWQASDAPNGREPMDPATNVVPPRLRQTWFCQESDVPSYNWWLYGYIIYICIYMVIYMVYDMLISTSMECPMSVFLVGVAGKTMCGVNDATVFGSVSDCSNLVGPTEPLWKKISNWLSHCPSNVPLDL